ncbi:hypothetical protein Dsin_013414 [Dipteronia sinensis]|uniref:Uncharacterized protein n=1 Tax=Dipteronia sinensis TaxID=43782 RepID=A0AAE0E935_9ROSI|nr:hypothetical protein Dsin_013414 [Dipteronia sinensis]
MRLVDEDGNVHEDEDDITRVVCNYFSDLFSSSLLLECDLNAATQFIYNRFDREMVDLLSSEFTSVEVRAAVFGLGPSKAPGPDGFQALLFSRSLGMWWGKISLGCV